MRDSLDISWIDDITQKDVNRLNPFKAAFKFLGAQVACLQLNKQSLLARLLTGALSLMPVDRKKTRHR